MAIDGSDLTRLESHLLCKAWHRTGDSFGQNNTRIVSRGKKQAVEEIMDAHGLTWPKVEF